VYGYFAVVLGLLSWLYLGSQVVLYAAEVNVVMARRLWPRSLLQPPLTTPDQRALVDLAKQQERRPEESVAVRFTSQGTTPPSGWPVAQDDRPQGAPTEASRADTRPPGRDPRR
jgi:hypothetical protein